MNQTPFMKLLDYFDRLSIIHLRHRSDRYRALVSELRLLGIQITDSKVRIPEAPMPPEANGFASRGVYGSFLSHLEILTSAQNENLKTVWVLEDDAIFSHRFAREQREIANFLAQSEWDICYFGHSLTKQLEPLDVGLPRYCGEFYWAHCYAVHARVLPRLIGYLEETIARPSGHPLGGKMYIDAAYSLFRKFNPDVITLVSNPVLSVQRGSPSSLAHGRWYDRYPLLPMITLVRAMRDECWRRTGWTYGGAAPRNLGD